MARIIVIGGGYAGLACLAELRKKDPGHELHLVDGRSEHCKLINLHKSIRSSREDVHVPFSRLAREFDFSFHQEKLVFNEQDLVRWQRERSLVVAGSQLDFDYLVVSSGSASPAMEDGASKFQQALWKGEGHKALERLVGGKKKVVEMTLVGGGATGLQFLFEIHEALRRRRQPAALKLIDMNRKLAPDQPDGVHDYLARKLRRAGVDYRPATKFLGVKGRQVELEDLERGEDYSLSAGTLLFFPGVVPSPLDIETNPYGQVERDGELLSAIFAAGDCARYRGRGLNRLTAQAAVRKGKQVARNISNLERGRSLQRYAYQEKGYLVGVGSLDAVGWLGLRCNLVKGFPASLLKDAMETQWDLYLKGVDTFVDLP